MSIKVKLAFEVTIDPRTTPEKVAYAFNEMISEQLLLPSALIDVYCPALSEDVHVLEAQERVTWRWRDHDTSLGYMVTTFFWVVDGIVQPRTGVSPSFFKDAPGKRVTELKTIHPEGSLRLSTIHMKADGGFDVPGGSADKEATNGTDNTAAAEGG